MAVKWWWHTNTLRCEVRDHFTAADLDSVRGVLQTYDGESPVHVLIDAHHMTGIRVSPHHIRPNPIGYRPVDALVIYGVPPQRRSFGLLLATLLTGLWGVHSQVVPNLEAANAYLQQVSNARAPFV